MACDLRCDLDGITQANAGAFARKLAANTGILRLRVTPSLPAIQHRQHKSPHFACLLEPSDGLELDEILGYHLEQAARYLAELGRADAELAEQAASRLATAGRTAPWRGDMRAARSLLERALALSERPDVHLVVDFAESSRSTDLGGAVEALDEAAHSAEKVGDAAGAALARASAAALRLETVAASADDLERLAHAALPLLEAAGDHAGLARIWASLAFGVYNMRCRYDQMEHAAEQELRHARLAGEKRTDPGTILLALRNGSRPVDEALQRLESGSSRSSKATTRVLPNGSAICAIASPSKGARHCFPPTRPLRGRMLCALGRYDEAEQLAVQGHDLGDEDDPVTQSLWRQVAALVAAHRGEHTDTERLAREALAHSHKTDSPQIQGDAYYDLAEVLEAAGRRDEAIAAWKHALDSYERKGIVPLVRRVGERLAALQPV